MPAEIPEARIGPPIFSASAGVLFLLCVMYAMTYIDRNNVSTAAFVFKKDLGLTNTQVGLVFSAFAYPYLIFQIVGGWVSDRFGPRRSLTVCALIWGAATLVTGLATGLTTLLCARLLLGLGEGATFPTATRAMCDSGSASGLMNSGTAFAAIISPLVFGYVIDKTGNWELPFLGSIGLLLVGSILAFWMKPEEGLVGAQLSSPVAVKEATI